MRPDSTFLKKPMDSFGDLLAERFYPFLAAGGSLAFVLWYLNKYLLTSKEISAMKTLVTLLFIGMTVVSLRLLRKNRPAELRLLLQNACWIILSRLLLEKLNFAVDSENYWAVLYFCFFGVGIALKKGQRNVFLTVLTVIVCGTLLVWAAAAVLTVMRGVPLNGLKRLSDGIQLKREITILSVSFFNIHRNMTGIWFLMPICLMLYQCVRHRHWGWYVAAGVTIPLWYAAIALQHSRSTYLASAICLALLMGRLAMRLIRKRSRAAGIIAAVVVTAGFTVLLYQGFFGCSDLIARGSREPQPELIYTGADAAGVTETESADTSVHDSRSLATDARTLTGRTSIWKAILPLLKSKRQLVLGRPASVMMEAISEQLGWKVWHMHNTLLQQLLMAGVPGFLLYLLLLLSLAVRIVKCYFRKDGCGREETLVLGIALTGAMIYGMVEPLLCGNIRFMPPMFCLLAGCFVGELSDEDPSAPAA